MKPVPWPFTSMPAASPIDRTRKQSTGPRQTCIGWSGSWPTAISLRHNAKTGVLLRTVMPQALAVSDAVNVVRMELVAGDNISTVLDPLGLAVYVSPFLQVTP